MSTMPSNGQKSKQCVFIVDDDEGILTSLKLVLGREYQVYTETRALAAVEAIKKLSPDVVIVDLKMPIHDGFWTFAEIRKFDPDVPIIINSAYQDMVPPHDVGDIFRPFASVQKGGSLSTFMGAIKKAAAMSAIKRAAAERLLKHGG